MKPDDRICYCFNVPLGKLVRFARRERPERASRMSECLGAGTGCGWCVPFLEKIAENPERFDLGDTTAAQYEEARQKYIAAGRTREPS